MSKYYGGIEGGGTGSSLAIYDVNGKEICLIEDGPGTNLFSLGVNESAERLKILLGRGLKELGVASLLSIGMSLSGGGIHKETTDLIRKKIIGLSESVCVTSDLEGSMASAGKPDFTLIAGTGSACRSSSGKRSGGWGHFLGDEGSAHWIANLAAKWMFRELDSMSFQDGLDPPHSTRAITEVFREYFGFQDHSDLLPHCYFNHSKDHFAGVAFHLAEVARNTRDPAILALFTLGGASLARHILALEEESSSKGDILCIGSVWRSWDLLQEGFIRTLEKENIGVLKKIRLLRLNKSAALGAAYLGALEIGVNLPFDFTQNYNVLYEHEL